MKAKQCFCSSFRGKDTLVSLLIQHDLERQDGIFHDDFINDATRFAERTYDNAPNVIEDCEKRLPELRQEREEVIARVRAERGWRYYNDAEYLAIDKRVNDYMYT